MIAHQLTDCKQAYLMDSAESSTTTSSGDEFDLRQLPLKSSHPTTQPLNRHKMALDDASPQGGISPSNNAPSNPSSASPASNNLRLPDYSGLTIKKELMHRPDLFTLYFGFLGDRMWKASAAAKVADRLQGTWVLTGRGATQEETDAFTMHSTRSLYYSRIGIPLSTFVGGLFMYRGFARLMPHETAIGRFRKLKTMLQLNRTEVMRGMSGSAFKLLFIGCTGGMISAIFGTYVDVKGLVTDPRLQQWSQDTKDTSEEGVRKRRTFLAMNNAQAVRNANQFVNKLVNNDFSSGGFGDPAPEQYNYDEPVQSESVSQPQQIPATPSSRPAYGWSRQQQPPPKSQSSGDFFGDDDDASPTAAEYRNTNPDGSPMSSWDRVRAQTAASTPQKPARQSPTAWSPPQNQSESADMGPVGARDKYDYDRRREREQAQADFDQMMENERKGSDGPTRGGWGS